MYALNIQRARDHGLPSYNACRERAGMGKLRSFRGMSNNYRTVARLNSVYKSIDDLDLWVGIVCEDTNRDGAMGEVGSKIVPSGFKRIRDGDRFWYEYAFPKWIIK